MVFYFYLFYFFVFFSNRKLFTRTFFIKKNLKLDPDPHWEKQLDPDPQKINLDPQPCQGGFYLYEFITVLKVMVFRYFPGCIYIFFRRIYIPNIALSHLSFSMKLLARRIRNKLSGFTTLVPCVRIILLFLLFQTGTFLNDVIIDFYLKYLQYSVLSEADRDR